ncbi:50S ribosomal protein L2 [Aestuariivirga litoralis]|uniref:50S ribosomal protein L2 n=1 Tax=Aestuariivirga litoralis TaxID=2650924 RepID=UPI0018C83B09|nr:50S ribosomal protein L2 [Aestuariivirga litoralis]MBG1231513.1 50S ribosomal protein L2 [Aestuariivirga litoralis]
MALKTFNPTSAGRRHLIQVDRSHLFKGKPVKALIEGQHAAGGRGNTGRITSRRKGGGHKTAYRLIDFKRTKHDMPATVERIEYDPNRTGFIALIKYQDETLSYILAPQRLAVGDTVISGKLVDVKPGNAMEIGSVPVGTVVHNIETKPGAGGSLARAAGTYALVAGRDGGNVIIRLKSGETRLVPANGMASVGAVSNQDHINEVIGKAGRARWKGARPVSRGIARNPVDHPNGGRTNGGKHWATPWGKPTKGYKTRVNKRTSKMIVRSRHDRKKAQ